MVKRVNDCCSCSENMKQVIASSNRYENFFKKDLTITLLGPWCEFDQSGNKFPHKVHKYHWENHEVKIRDNEYILRLYINVLPKLADWLNNFHRTSFSNRYW